jgi:DNA-binding beta-propeller fold protein YncE
MFRFRAPAFADSLHAPLLPVAGWPVLPDGWVLDRVVGIGVDSRGRIFVAHRGQHPFLCFHADGRFSHEVGAEHQRATTAYDLRGPVPIPIATRTWLHGLHIDPWDNVWITDVGRHLLMKFSPEGALLLTLGVDGESGCDDRRFAQPTHVCVNPAGELFITDGYGNSRIVHCRADGTFIREWGRRGTEPGEFHTPHVITLADDGRLYMTDRENDRIQVFTQSGEVVDVWPGLHSVDGLHAAADGFIYGSSGIDRAVVKFDRRGRRLAVWIAPGDCLYPHGIFVTPQGDLYLADTGDRWEVTGPRPEERRVPPRSGPEGSAVRRFRLPR